MRRTIEILAALTFCCGNLLAQRQQSDPSIEIASLSKQRAELAKEWLQSADPQHIAWGAAIARQDAIDDLTPLLISQLDDYHAAESLDGSYVAPADPDRHDAMLNVLDALVVGHKNVAAKTSVRLFGEFPVQSLILLARSGDSDRNEVLLNIFKTYARYDDAWLAAGNILVDSSGDTPGFAFAVLSRFTQRLSIEVVDKGSGVGAGWGTGSCGDALVSNKTGWPPVGIYSLSHGHRYNSGRTVLADGAEPVYYERFDSRTYHFAGGCDDSVNRDLMRAQYINRMLGDPPRVHLLYDSSRVIHWIDPAGYKREVLEAIVQQRSQLLRAIQLLLAKTRLTEEEFASLRPHVEVAINDMRGDKAVALPQVMPSDPNTRFVSQFSTPQR